MIPAINQSANGRVVALASRSEEKAAAVAKTLGIGETYGSYEQLLASPNVDAVYVPLPNSMHLEWTLRAAEEGKHVLCEKPMALNARQCEDMISACARHHVWLMEAFMYRFHPGIVRLKQMTDASRVGRIVVIRSALSFAVENLNDIRYQKELGGGALMDAGCYCVNIARLLTGAEPTSVQAEANFNEQKRVDETFTGTMRFPDGTISVFDTGFKTKLWRQSVEVAGENGSLEVPEFILPRDDGSIIWKQVTAESGDYGQAKVINTGKANPYQVQAEHFADCIINDHESLYPPKDAANNMKVIERLYESVKRA